MKARFIAVLAGIGIGYGLLLFKLVDVQLAKNGSYLARAQAQYEAAGFLYAPRGTIYFSDKNGNPLPIAVDKDFPIVYAVPKAIDDALEAGQRLSAVLGVSADELTETFLKGASYEVLKKRADPEVAKAVEELGLKGMYVAQIPGRYYPLGNLASHLVGFVGEDEKENRERGRYGLEAFYDELLSGVNGELDDGKLTPPAPGGDLRVTVDPTIQLEAERILSALVAKHGAEGGNVIVQEPKTGKLLAAASVPTFDPNSYGKTPLSHFLNPVVQQIYEPGSVFKVLTMSAGIDAGKITPETTYVDKGSATISGRKIENWDLKTHGPHGRVTMTGVIENSINTGAIFAQQQTGNETFKEYLTRFGFGEKTGVDMAGELSGDVKLLFRRDAPAVAFATASFGQGVAATPLQIINAFSVIANGGVLMHPYVNAALAPKEVRRVISQDTAKKVAKMMVSAVDKAEIARISGYSIAGKTGTAFIPDFTRGGYTDLVINTYVGFGPASDPRFVILFKLNKPQGAPLAGTTVVPAFRELAQFLLNYYQMPPDRITTSN